MRIYHSAQQYQQLLNDQQEQVTAFLRCGSVTTTCWYEIWQALEAEVPHLQMLPWLHREEEPCGRICWHVDLNDDGKCYQVVRFHYTTSVPPSFKKLIFWLGQGRCENVEQISYEEIQSTLSTLGLPPDGWSVTLPGLKQS